MRSEGFYVNEKSTDTSWDRTSGLPICSTTSWKVPYLKRLYLENAALADLRVEELSGDNGCKSNAPCEAEVTSAVWHWEFIVSTVLVGGFFFPAALKVSELEQNLVFLFRYTQRGGDTLILFSTAKDSFLRDIVGEAPNLPVNLADRTNSSSEKHKFITASISFHWSPFVTCLAYDKPKIKFMPSCK